MSRFLFHYLEGRVRQSCHTGSFLGVFTADFVPGGRILDLSSIYSRLLPQATLCKSPSQVVYRFHEKSGEIRRKRGGDQLVVKAHDETNDVGSR